MKRNIDPQSCPRRFFESLIIVWLENRENWPFQRSYWDYETMKQRFASQLCPRVFFESLIINTGSVFPEKPLHGRKIWKISAHEFLS